MVAVKPDTRTRESMAADADGEWKFKPSPVKSNGARKRVAANAPKPRFANIDGVRKEVHQARPKDARPYPTAPVGARPGSRIAVAELRGSTDPGIPHLPRRAIGPKLDIARVMSKAEQANNLPFVPEFQAEGQPFPRVARNADGVVMPRVRKDNGMTKQLQGRGIGKDGKTGLDAYTKRQLALYAEYGIGKDRSATREEYAAHTNKGRSVLKDKINEALACERAALARGDVAAAEAARAEVRQLRKAARSKA